MEFNQKAMTYKETDELSTLKVGDTLVMNDGSCHEAVNGIIGVIPRCDKCSMFHENCNGIKCTTMFFHFKKLTP